MTKAEKLWEKAAKMESDFERFATTSASLHIKEEREQVRAHAQELRRQAQQLFTKRRPLGFYIA